MVAGGIRGAHALWHQAALPVWFGDGAREQEKWDRRIVESEVLQEKRHSERDRHGNKRQGHSLELVRVLSKLGLPAPPWPAFASTLSDLVGAEIRGIMITRLP